jgi:hypothetical protein
MVCASAFVAWLSSLDVVACNEPFRGPQARAAAAASTERGFLSPAHTQEFRFMGVLCRRAVAVLLQQAHAAERWRTHALRSGAAAAPAWALLPPEGLPMESVIRMADAASYASLVPLPDDACDAERAVAAELLHGIVLGGDLDVRILSALAQLKTAPLAEFLTAAEGKPLLQFALCVALPACS